MASRSQRWSIPAFKITLVLLMHLTLAEGISYVCLLPQTIRPGMDLSASVTLHRANGPVSLKLSVISNATGSVIATTEMKDIAVGKNPETRLMKLKIPIKLLESEYLVTVSGSSNKAQIFTNSTMVTVIQKTNLLFVQTDKAMYKPGQTVLFRVVAIYPTMKPCKDKMDIVISDPQQNRIAQWLQKQDEQGVVSGELALSSQTPLGTWMIKVQTPVDTFTKTFEVAEYVLPKFEVNVIVPPHYTLLVNKQKQQPSIFVTVTARYTYGQPVKGTVTLSGQVFRFSWQTDIVFMVKKTASLKNGTAHLEFTPQELSYMVPNNLKETIPGNVPAWTLLNSRDLVFTAQVNETVTGIALSSNSTVTCHDRKYVLEFLEITPESYRLGLNYTGFLVLKQQDGEIPLLRDIQLPNGRFREVNITISSGWTFLEDCDKKHHVLNVPLTANGFMSFQVNLNMNCNYDMEAVFNDESTGATSNAYKKIDPFESATPVGFQISLKETTSVIKAGDVVQFEMRSTDVIKEFFYCLMSKGEIVLTKSVSNVQTKIHLLKINIDSALAQKLSPLMRIVAWIVVRNTKDSQMFEVISDSIQVNVEGAFVNNVTLGFDSDKVQPGDNVTLEVKASGGSNVFVLAVDQSVLLLKGGNDITQDSVLDALSSYEDKTEISRPEIISRRWHSLCLRCPWWPIFPSGQDSIEIFQEAKLICLTDGYLHRRKLFIRRRLPIPIEPMPDIVFADGAIHKTEPGVTPPEKAPVSVRTKFPETWIWDNKTTGSDGVGTFKVTAPDTMTSWVASAFAVHSSLGLGISPITSSLTVYRPFFISMTLPYSIRRGEVFALKATVFNYLNESLTVKVTLKKSDSFIVQLEKEFSKNKDLVKTIKVRKNDATSVTFLIDATRLGEIPVEVLAQGGAAGDGERRTVLVTPEGIEQHYSTSVLIDNSKQDKPFETKWNVVLPSKVKGYVPDSATLQVTAIGDILGPALNGLEKLISMPHGCGEQLMVSTAPNVFILKSLRLTGLLTKETEDKCKKYLLAGYQAELTFQRSDGSFSAFGNGDPSGSIWLSAYVVLIFGEAKYDIPIEDSKLALTLLWIITNQNKNGSFTEPPNGRVLSNNMQGGASKGVPLTAYVLIALISNQNNSALNESLIKDSISKAVHYLELQLNSLKDSYSLCIVSYALVLAHSSKASMALKKRDAMAIKTDDHTHWENVGHSPANSDSFIPPFIQPEAIDIELTSYALLTCTYQNDMKNCLAIAKWLIAQRNPYGGFSSTQDTVVGLQALASFASRMFGKRSSFRLSVTASNGKQDHTFDPLTPKNMLTLQKWEPTEARGPVVIKAKGLGIGLVQLNVKYNVYKLPSDRGLVLTVNPVVIGDGQQIVLTICAKWTKEYQGIGMVLLMIQLPSGYGFDSIEEVDERRGWLKKVETDYNAVSVYFDTLDKVGTCVKVTLIRQYYVNNLKSSSVKLLEYYNPSNFVCTTYSVYVRAS